MQLFFIYGPAASGKLTVALELGEKIGFPIFHNHLVVDMLLALFEFGVPAFVELREMIWLQVMGQAAQERLPGLIFTFTPERTVRPDFIGRLASTVEKAEGEVLVVQLTCPEEELERRIENESRAEFGKLRSLELYRQLRDEGAFAFPPVPNTRLTIDTSKSDANASASKIVEYFGLPTRS
ncbi:MAG: AAA family ATPase [Dehalococcoidia bacterium]|jgi:hypothetical protein|nr:AAA family ATPase [Dehalococcoidia bacterium]